MRVPQAEGSQQEKKTEDISWKYLSTVVIFYSCPLEFGSGLETRELMEPFMRSKAQAWRPKCQKTLDATCLFKNWIDLSLCSQCGRFWHLDCNERQQYQELPEPFFVAFLSIWAFFWPPGTKHSEQSRAAWIQFLAYDRFS